LGAVSEMKVLSVLMTRDSSSFETFAMQSIRVEVAGIPGDRHYGLLRPADGRQKLYPRGTPIANRRQISIVSAEECARIANSLGVPSIRPEWLGANVLVSGAPALSALPRGARLLFSGGTGLICEGENLPCVGPGELVERALGRSGLRSAFVQAAMGRRGIVCSVEKEGMLAPGETVRVAEGS